MQLYGAESQVSSFSGQNREDESDEKSVDL